MIKNGNISFPSDVDITLNFQNSQLTVSWKTPISTHGTTTAVVSPTKGHLPSALKPIRKIHTWVAFKRYVSELPSEQFIFRGQQNADWRLRTTFHRHARCNLQKFLTTDVPELQRVFSSLTTYRYNLDNGHEYAAFLSLAQHHGYPTPMLDWTWSPYIAAFFAYRNLRSRGRFKRNDKVRILKFSAYEWNTRIRRFNGLFPFPQHVSLLVPLAIGNARAIPQQALSMITNIDDVETYLSNFDGALGGTPALEAIDLPASARPQVMQDLALMGITSASLFPGLDGACEALREKNFSSSRS